MYALSYLHMMALRLRKNNAGAVATEYAFLVAFIAIVGAGGMVILGENLYTFFEDIGDTLLEAGKDIPVPGS